MKFNIETYLSDAIERLPIKRIGYIPKSNIPFVVLEDNLVFYGRPHSQDKLLENIFVGTAKIIQDLEYRFFQSRRVLKQHSNYQYQTGDVVVELGAYLG
jgi:hypothetical protein